MSEKRTIIISAVITILLDIALIIHLSCSAGKLLDAGVEQSLTSHFAGIEIVAGISEIIDKKIVASDAKPNAVTVYYEDNITYHCNGEYKDKEATIVYTFHNPQGFNNEKIHELVTLSFTEFSAEELKELTDSITTSGEYTLAKGNSVYSAKNENGTVTLEVKERFDKNDTTE